MRLGGFQINALSDGTLRLPVPALLTDTRPDRVRTALPRSALKDPTAVNGVVINTVPMVLVDVGTGALFGPTVGVLVNGVKDTGTSWRASQTALGMHLKAMLPNLYPRSINAKRLVDNFHSSPSQSNPWRPALSALVPIITSRP